MTLLDWTIFWLDIAWRTLAGLVSLGLNAVGIPALLVIVVAAFCWLLYKWIKKVRG